MKKNLYLLMLAAAAIALMPACKKHKGSSNDEPILSVQTTPAVNTTDPPAPGPDFPVVIQITSTMPPGGVKVEVTAKKDGSADPAFFTSSVNSNAASNNVTITGTPATVICMVTIKVTSLSNSGNSWMGSYRYSKK